MTTYRDILDFGKATSTSSYFQGAPYLQRNNYDLDWEFSAKEPARWLPAQYRKAMKYELAQYEKHFLNLLMSESGIFSAYRSGSGSGKSSYANHISTFHIKNFPTSLLNEKYKDFKPSISLNLSSRKVLGGLKARFLREDSPESRYNPTTTSRKKLNDKQRADLYSKFKSVLITSTLGEISKKSKDDSKFLIDLFYDLNKLKRGQCDYLDDSTIEFAYEHRERLFKCENDKDLILEIKSIFKNNEPDVILAFDFLLLTIIKIRYGSINVDISYDPRTRTLNGEKSAPLLIILDNADHLKSYLLYYLFQDICDYATNKENEIHQSLFKIITPLRLASTHEVALAGANINPHFFSPPKPLPILTLKLEKFLFSEEVEYEINNNDQNTIRVSSRVYELLMHIYDPDSEISMLLNNICGSNIRSTTLYTINWLSSRNLSTRKNIGSIKSLKEARETIATLAFRRYIEEHVKHLSRMSEFIASSNLLPDEAANLLRKTILRDGLSVATRTKEKGVTFPQTHMRKLLKISKIDIAGTFTRQNIDIIFSGEKPNPFMVHWGHMPDVRAFSKAFSKSARRIIPEINDAPYKNLLNNSITYFQDFTIGKRKVRKKRKRQYSRFDYYSGSSKSLTAKQLNSRKATNRYKACHILFQKRTLDAKGFSTEMRVNIKPVNLFTGKRNIFNPTSVWILSSLRKQHEDENVGINFGEMCSIGKECGLSAQDVLSILHDFVNVFARLVYSAVDDQNILKGMSAKNIDLKEKYFISEAGLGHLTNLGSCVNYLDWAAKQLKFCKNSDFITIRENPNVMRVPRTSYSYFNGSIPPISERLSASILLLWEMATREREFYDKALFNRNYNIDQSECSYLDYMRPEGLPIYTMAHVVTDKIIRQLIQPNESKGWNDWIFEYINNLSILDNPLCNDYVLLANREKDVERWKARLMS